MATFHQISSQNLECPICLSLFNRPKSLACSHTFCKHCLERVFETQRNQQAVKCPVCRKGTPLPSGNVGKLQTNLPLSSLVDEVKAKSPTCTVCKMDEKLPAVSYCQDCGKYMCKSCEKAHSIWTPFSIHSVVAMSEVLSGKVPIKRRQKCKKHPNDDEEYFCTGCREYVCLRCGMLEHLQAGHQIKEASIHEDKVMTNIKELQEKTKSKKTTIENHIDFITTQRNEITNTLRKLNVDIDKTYEEYMKLLSARREALKSQVKRLSKKFEKELQTMEEESRQSVSQMNAMEELVTNGMKVPLEKDALTAHDTLCENLKIFLGHGDPDDQSPRGVTERAKKISFRKHVKVNELCLGELEGYTWNVKADVELPSKGIMECVTRAPQDSKIVVGTWQGGIHFYSPDGELQQTVLKDVSVVNIGFLSDGRSVVRDTDNNMSLYTQQWKKLDVTFKTMSYDEGGLGGLTVDRHDNIHMSYWKHKKIQVFIPRGGNSVREIVYDGYLPDHIFSIQSTGKLIVKDISDVVCIDGKGKKENVLTKKGMNPYPAVCRDDSVIVAWVKHEEGLVSIDRYTRDLDHVRNLITDFKMQKAERGLYSLKEFESGEIAFCTPDRLYIFDIAS
ncbi:uncharacterized protein [Diadema setosum]|uniref:uncharacterized protein n=1 Tax=Diadema setosum TaxID=31175 RepID=UPI003B3A9D4A